jgi:hypothetical protein
VISSDGTIDTRNISNLICCTGGSGSSGDFSITTGATSCSEGQTPVPFSELPTAGDNIVEGTDTTIIQNFGTSVESQVAETQSMKTSTVSSSAAEETSGSDMTSSAGAAAQSSGAAESPTGTSTGGAVMMTAGPMAGALIMAGGFMAAAL